MYSKCVVNRRHSYRLIWDAEANTKSLNCSVEQSLAKSAAKTKTMLYIKVGPDKEGCMARFLTEHRPISQL